MKRLILLLLLTGCASVQPVLDSLNGRHMDELIVAWGPPQAVQRLSNGGSVASWLRAENYDTMDTLFTSKGRVAGYATGGSETYTCKVLVTLDAGDRIAAASAEGLPGPCGRMMRPLANKGKTGQ